MKLKELTKKEFNSFLKDYSKDNDLLFFESTYWIDIKKKNGWDGLILGLIDDNNNILCASIFLMKKIKVLNKYMVYAPRGYLIDYSNYHLLKEFTNALKKEFKKRKALFLKINPYVKYQDRDSDGNIISKANNELIKELKDLGYYHQGFYVEMDKKKDLEPRWLSVLDLNKDLDTIFKEFRQTTRWSIRNSEKNCLKIIECDKSNLIEFKKLMEHTALRRDFIDRPLSYYENLYDILSKDKLIKILIVEINFKDLLNNVTNDYKELIMKITRIENNSKREKELKELEAQKESFNKRINDLKEYIKTYGDKLIIAGGLYMLYGNHLVYLLGASYKEFMKYNSQYLLQWEMIKYAKNNNYKKFNFYGIDGNFNKNYKNYGLFDFKRGFNCNVVELIGEFDLVFNKFEYKLYNILYKTYRLVKNIRKK